MKHDDFKALPAKEGDLFAVRENAMPVSVMQALVKYFKEVRKIRVAFIAVPDPMSDIVILSRQQRQSLRAFLRATEEADSTPDPVMQ